MNGRMMRKVWLVIAVCSCTTLLLADDWTVCQGKYALCTTASCTPIPGQEGSVACGCEVKTGYSAGHEACHKAEAVAPGQVMSRYYPVKYFAYCSNNRPWASCLDKPCTIDKNDPSKASCTCTVEKGQGDYVLVTSTYTDKTCTTGIQSSATLKDANAMTDFLKTQEHLKPFPIKIVSPKK